MVRERADGPGRDVLGHGGRLALLATAAFLLNVFVAPQTQFRNEFLRDERGLSAAAVSLFALATSMPAAAGWPTPGAASWWRRSPPRWASG